MTITGLTLIHRLIADLSGILLRFVHVHADQEGIECAKDVCKRQPVVITFRYVRWNWFHVPTQQSHHMSA
jgi:hypothetical protein